MGTNVSHPAISWTTITRPPFHENLMCCLCVYSTKYFTNGPFNLTYCTYKLQSHVRCFQIPFHSLIFVCSKYDCYKPKMGISVCHKMKYCCDLKPVPFTCNKLLFRYISNSYIYLLFYNFLEAYLLE